jgi:ubiquinone/menaquinone biosynthesis C-methylase UbiE
MRGRHLSAADERDFERSHISAHRERYLNSDVLERIQYDKGYREKVSLIEDALNGTDGWILDFGANTCGEAEVLSTRGYSIVAMDINEIALGLSKERVRRFGRSGPSYVAGDGHQIPLESESVSFVTCFESLHHMEDPSRALKEISRILTPGGRALLYEPYSRNPYRRLSELRDRFRGSIEKSFAHGELTRLVRNTGLELVHLRRSLLPASTWRKEALSRSRRMLKDTYYAVARRVPAVFGNLFALAIKPGTSVGGNQRTSFESILRCPISGERVIPISSGFINTDPDSRLLYPSHEGIPVLIAGDAVSLDHKRWTEALNQARDGIET